MATTELSGDEALVMLGGAIGTIATAFRWAWWAGPTPWHWRRARAARRWVRLTPLACLAGLYAALRAWAAHDVRDEPVYLILFTLVGVLLLAGVMGAGQLLGLSPRDDAADRANTPAAIALAGAMTGATAAYAGANAGEGDTIWTTLVPAALALATMFALWAALERFANLSESIAVERDLPAGVRAAGFFAATGLILGRAVAGDYVSAAGTLADFAALGWPVLPLTLAAAIAQRVWRPQPDRLHPPLRSAGILPAAAMLLVSLIWLLATGRAQ